MSLGNLQYHFRNQAALMAGLAEYYFAECVGMLDEYRHSTRNGSHERQLHRLILFFLDHVDHISDMCRIFREMWALSARDEELHQQLTDYYQASFEKLSALIAPSSGSEKSARNIAMLLIPYFEGYSITFPALPQKKKETARMLTKLAWSMREEAGTASL